MICLCSKYVKNCNIFGQILNIWVKLIIKKIFNFFFQCVALPKDPQSVGSQNLRCPFSVSQYYRRRRLWGGQHWVNIGPRSYWMTSVLTLTEAYLCSHVNFWKVFLSCFCFRLVDTLFSEKIMTFQNINGSFANNVVEYRDNLVILLLLEIPKLVWSKKESHTRSLP